MKVKSDAMMEENVGAIKIKMEDEARLRLEEVESLTVQLASQEQERMEMSSKVQEERARVEQERAVNEQQVLGLKNRLSEQEAELVKVPLLVKEVEEKTVQLESCREQVGSPSFIEASLRVL